MHILRRIISMAWRYRMRLLCAYVSFFTAIGFALLAPRLLGGAIDRLVRFEASEARFLPVTVDTGTLLIMALTLLGVGFRVKAPVARRPPHRSGREGFPHPVPR